MHIINTLGKNNIIINKTIDPVFFDPNDPRSFSIALQQTINNINNTTVTIATANTGGTPVAAAPGST